MLKISNLKKLFGSKTVFESAELKLGEKEKAGLVGVNGAGKTTLFSILSGEDKEFEGNISFNTRDPLIGYMKQEVDIDFSDISGRDFDLFVEKKFFDIK